VSFDVPVPTDDFAEFYEASYGRVVALVAAIVGERHQAEDIAQEAFSRALTRWSRVARYDLPEAWVRRVALRLSIDAGRRTRRAALLSRGTWQPAGSLPAPDASLAAAPYFVTIPARGASAVVTDAFTGQVMGSVRPGSGQDFAGVAAAGDDHTFVLPARETGAVGFYELRLRPDGREESLSPLFTLPTRTVPMFAVSPDASLLAYTTGTGIETVSLAAGTGRSWAVADGQTFSLSWAGDTTLAFEWQVSSSGGAQPAGAGLRLLDIAALGTLIRASRLLIPYCLSAQVCVVAPLISPDGSTVIATSLALGSGVTTTVEEYSARTGRPLGAVSPAVTTPRGSQACDPLWTDPSGQQAAVFCGNGFVTDGTRFTMADLHLPAGSLRTRSESFAW
jgi:hypothetical protein